MLIEILFTIALAASLAYNIYQYYELKGMGVNLKEELKKDIDDLRKLLSP